MPAPARLPNSAAVGPVRRALDAGWWLAGAGSAVAGEAPPPGDADWLFIDRPEPVAAALQAAGRWSLAGPPRRFDGEAWCYRMNFDAEAEHAGPATLGFDGLATLAEATLNGEALLQSANMFRAHAVDVSGRLRARGNELLLRFAPLDAALAERRPRPRWRAPMVEHQQLRHFRTTLLGRTPGWSPPAAVVGPWQGVWLAAHGAPGRDLVTPRVTGLQLHSSVAQSTGRLQVRLHWAGRPPQRLRVQLARGARTWQCVLAAGDTTAGETEWVGQVEVQPVERWWPHTHGEPALYALRLIVDDEAAAPHTVPLGQVGFRSIELDRGADGRGFGLVVNGEPVFARGACWTPLDALRLHAEPAQVQAAIKQVRAAGMNLLRVGGTMAYESDAFLDACDAAGIMVWAELMFANMDYPGDDPAFLAEVDAELAQQLPRWQGRPAVVLVCGNSEVAQQAAMAGAARELWAPALFHEHMAAAVETQLPGMIYWPSSAVGGGFPFQPSEGTASYYGVGAYRREPGDAKASGLRFASECLAFANIPDAAALDRWAGSEGGGVGLRVHQPAWKARVPRDLGAGWDFDDVRDHYAEHFFGERSEGLRASDPARHLALGRAASGLAMQAAFTQWRSEGSACRGALVWFLRDLQAGAGWGLLDDEGHPKAAFHALARVLHPLHIGITDEGLNGLRLQFVNEGPRAVAGELELALYRHGETLLARERRAVELPPRSTRSAAVLDWLPAFLDLNWAYRFGPPDADLLVATLFGSGGAVLRQVLHAAPGKRAHRAGDIGLQAHAEALPDGRQRVHVRSRAAAFGIHLEAHGWRASDAGFDLPPGGQHVFDATPLPTANGRHRAWRASVDALNAREPVVVRALSEAAA